MNLKLFLLINHQITVDQQTDALSSLAISSIVEPPKTIRSLWKNVPPDLPAIKDYLAPVKTWLTKTATTGDCLLVQGDFGATYLMVRYAFENGLNAVYSTTERQVKETHLADGTVNAAHIFKHCIFRRYGG